MPLPQFAIARSVSSDAYGACMHALSESRRAEWLPVAYVEITRTKPEHLSVWLPVQAKATSEECDRCSAIIRRGPL